MKRRNKKFKMEDVPEIDRLCKIHCTVDEICAFFGSTKNSYSPFFRDAMGMTLADYVEMKTKSIANPSLRRMQLLAARRGSVPMLIWLGKQYLAQTDKQEVNNVGETRGIIVVPAIASVEDWEAIAKKSQESLIKQGEDEELENG